ncbi:MAG: glycosyltransferase family 4 protein [Dechloromonas sp.]|nr:MAG: glycosyltransferase family 4 protein [Dechloromonas sp.]
MLRLLITATSFPATPDDWRGRFIYDMAESLASSGAAQLSFWGPGGELPPGVNLALRGDDGAWLGRMVARGGIAHLLRNRPLIGGATALGLLHRLRRVYQHFAAGSGPAVVHVNWLQNMLPLKGLRLPALVTVLGSDLALLRLPGMVPMLRAVLRERQAILAPNAEWMAPMLQRHFGDVAEIRAIPFGIHPRWFAIERPPVAAASSKWLVVSRVTSAKLGHLVEWGEGVFGGDRQLHLLGPMQEALELPGWVHYHGPTHPQALAEDWFPRVQGLLTLSTHDEGRPQVMIEAMAAGLPIIASDLPAHRDLLQEGALGRLVDSQQGLVRALNEFACPVANCAQGERAAAWVQQEIGTWRDAAQRYGQAYRDLLP